MSLSTVDFQGEEKLITYLSIIIIIIYILGIIICYILIDNYGLYFCTI